MQMSKNDCGQLSLKNKLRRNIACRRKMFVFVTVTC